MTQARKLPPLGALRAFEAAARHLSFKAAADELGVTPTAISHQLRLLEDSIGQRLFVRQIRKVTLTPAGEALYPVLRDGLDSFALTLERLRAGPQRQRLTLSATPAFVARWLLPRLGDWQARHPEIDLHLHASEAPVDFSGIGTGGSADAAIRYGRGNWPDLHSELLLPSLFAPVASPRLKLRKPADLNNQTLLHFDWRLRRRDTPTWKRWADEADVELDVAGGLRFSDESHAIQAAIAGQGVALLGLPLVAAELASGALVQPFGPVLQGDGYHLVMPPERLAQPGIVALQGWLRDAARDSTS
ncbi:LysR substrate-binding domain-containing protein [Ferrovibrio sp.]|uniref:LysR substrate-binding domain-containing protein n=1 Tax=Ferrovibrio sp. TaxID=1917215 RepID=UPI000CBA4E54|nr:LysR substrate-binding domain-containing protein [Ferrovibrio sp.]PJI39061.1 MAG: LysR family transcriptional regulator [Ferrovibrio sp.]